MRLPSTARRSNHFRARETGSLIKPEENLQKNESVKINNAGLEYRVEKTEVRDPDRERSYSDP